VLSSSRVGRVICATDAGREGELIFRYIYEAAGCSKPISRLWISSLTPEAIRKGFDAIKPGSDYEPLAEAARGRSRADWLVGMNLSRAYTLTYGSVANAAFCGSGGTGAGEGHGDDSGAPAGRAAPVVRPVPKKLAAGCAPAG
jgi:DNA topoisomerase IA